MASKQEIDTQQGGKGNFANDPQRASEEGRKGGQQAHQGSSDSKAPGQQGGGSNFANDPEKASEAGRKGGQQSHKS